MESEKITSAIEAMLFLHGEPMAVSKLALTLGVSESDIDSGIEILQGRYDDILSGLMIIRHGGDIAIATKPEHAPLAEKLFANDREETLGKAALEVLSIVAYRGPVSRAKIEAIRGVNCSFSLRNLLIRGFIDRKTNPVDAREYEYTPSFELLEMLGIGAVEALPEYETLSQDKRLSSLEEELGAREENKESVIKESA